MEKIYICLSITLSVYNLACGLEPQVELIRALLHSEEAQLAHKKELIAVGKKQNKIRAATLVVGTLITAISSLYPKHDLRVEIDEKVPFSSLDRYMKAILTHALGLVIMGVGAYRPYKDTANIQIDIDHSKKRIELLRTAIDAFSQTKSNIKEASNQGN